MSQRGRNDVQTTALFMSDGHSNVNRQNTIPAAIALRHTGCIIIVFAIGANVGWDELNSIASQPVNRTVFAVGSYTQLPNIVSQVRLATSDGMYSVSQKNPPPPEVVWKSFPNGWECLITFYTPILRFLSTLDYIFLFNLAYLQLWRNYAIIIFNFIHHRPTWW